ncbi:hypothetical protein C8J56DRAFT_1032994 [Mycena floridula]|nr:hypothetical protein C8J56DRAFT_1032994 [Mycena floridula]
MQSLPIELVNDILRQVTAKPDLFSLRVANKALSQLVTPSTFRVIRVSKSLEHFVDLKESDLAKYVDVLELNRDAVEVSEEPNDALASTFGDAFSRLNSFTRLRELQLKFSTQFLEWDDEASPPSELLLQRAVLKAVATSSLPPSFVSLTLSNLVAMPYPELYSTDFFHTFMALPKHLTISVLWMDREGACFDESFREFWATNITQDILRPAHALESLSITSDLYIEVNFSSIHYPALRSFTIAGDFEFTGIEDCIVQHKETLQHLAIQKCMLFDADESPPHQMWSSIWKRFAEELSALISFTCEELPEDSGYVYCDPGWGYISHSTLNMGNDPRSSQQVFDEDRAALERFCTIVEQRALTKVVEDNLTASS